MRLQDLSNKQVVLGSGISGVAVARELLNAKKSVVMIDAGYPRNIIASKKERLSYQRMFVSLKFKLQEMSFAYANYKSLARIKEQGFNSIGSLAQGGLSNLWGANIDPYEDSDLDTFTYKKDDIKEISKELTNYYTNYSNQGVIAGRKIQSIDNRCLDLISKRLDEDSRVCFKPATIALARKDFDSKRECSFHRDCGADCPNKEIFNAKYELDDLLKHKNFTYIKGIYIKSVDKLSDGYLLRTIRLENQSKSLFKAKSVFCCLGTLSTTKLVLSMKKAINVNLPLLSTPAATFILFSLKKKKETMEVLPFANAVFQISISGQKVGGCLFPFPSDFLLNYLPKMKIINWLLNIARALIFDRLMIALVNFSSDYSSNTLLLDKDDNLVISSLGHSANLKNTFKNCMNLLKQVFKKEGYYVFPFKGKLLDAGEDIHIGGTLPMEQQPSEYACNQYGELSECKNFFITDPSALKRLAGKGHTFNSVVQSIYVVRNYLKRETK
jgi:hypothetical protein